ncbi:MAG: hypothetical protein ACKVOJ_06885 [Sphingomonadaceae bacterium]
MTTNLRKSADEAVKLAKEKASDAVALSRDTASKAAKVTAERLEGNPIAAVIGGLALGAIAAALLPRTQREDNLIGGVGTKVRETATNAAKAARDAGKAQLDTLGVTTDAAKEQFRDIAKKVGQAAASASSAAGDTLRNR